MRLNRIVLTDTLVGDHYVVEETHGPYIRVTSSQENHVEDGLKFWWQKTSPEEIKSVSKETADKGRYSMVILLASLRVKWWMFKKSGLKNRVRMFKSLF